MWTWKNKVWEFSLRNLLLLALPGTFFAGTVSAVLIYTMLFMIQHFNK